MQLAFHKVVHYFSKFATTKAINGKKNGHFTSFIITFERNIGFVPSINLAKTTLHPHLICQDYEVIKCMDWSLGEIQISPYGLDKSII